MAKPMTDDTQTIDLRKALRPTHILVYPLLRKADLEVLTAAGIQTKSRSLDDLEEAEAQHAAEAKEAVGVRTEPAKRTDILQDGDPFGMGLPEEIRRTMTDFGRVALKFNPAPPAFDCPKRKKRVQPLPDTEKAINLIGLEEQLVAAGYRLVDVHMNRLPGDRKKTRLTLVFTVETEEDRRSWDWSRVKPVAKVIVSRCLASWARSLYAYRNPNRTVTVNMSGPVHAQTNPDFELVTEHRNVTLTEDGDRLRWSTKPVTSQQATALEQYPWHNHRRVILKIALWPGHGNLPGDYVTLRTKMQFDEHRHSGGDRQGRNPMEFAPDGQMLSPEDVLRPLEDFGYVITDLALLPGTGLLQVTLQLKGREHSKMRWHKSRDFLRERVFRDPYWRVIVSETSEGPMVEFRAMSDAQGITDDQITRLVVTPDSKDQLILIPGGGTPLQAAS